MKNCNFLFLLIFIFSANQVYSQSNLDQTFVNNIEDLIKKKDYQNIELEQVKFLSFCKENDSLLLWMNSNKKWARSFFDQPNISMLFFKDIEQNLWREPLSPQEKISYTSFLLNFQYLYEMGYNDFIKAKIIAEKAHQFIQQKIKRTEDFPKYSKDLKTKVVQSEIYVLHHLANIYNRLGDEKKAENYFKEELAIAINNKRWNLIGALYGDLGKLYLNSNYPEKAMELYRTGLKNEFIQADSRNYLLLNYAHELVKFDSLNKAKLIAQQIEKELLQLTINNLPTLQGRQIILDEIWIQIYKKEKKDIKQAERIEMLLNKAHQSNPSKKGRQIAKYYLIYADFFFEKGAFENMNLYLDSAFQAIIPNYTFPIKITDIYPENTILEALEGKARLFETMAAQGDQENNLSQALACRALIFEVERALRSTYQYESSKLYLQELSRERTEKALDVAYQLYKITQEDHYKEQAFQLAERSKAILLSESIRALSVKEAFGLPEAILEREQELIAYQNYFQKTLIQHELAATVKEDSLHNQLKAQLFEVEQELYQLQDSIRTAYPKYAEQVQEIVPLDLSKLQAQLHKNDRTLVEYFIGSTHWYRFVLDGTNIQLERKELQSSLTTSIQNILQLLPTKLEQEKDYQRYLQLSQEVYKELIGDISISTNGLLIIPDGQLNYLPFESLICSKEGNTTNYLIQEKAISYAYSARVLEQYNSYSSTATQSYLGLAPVSFSKDMNLATLNFSEAEVTSVQALLEGQSLIKEKAQLTPFRTAAADYKIVHLSTHAGAGEVPWIAFQDEKMYLPEIYNLPLNADLVVLSACETGLGELQKGEGAMSLARGFAYAGAPSTLMSLWKVNEGATKTILQDFYTELKNGASKDDALRQAKLNFLANDNGIQQAPYFWSGLVVIGDAKAVFPTTNWWYWIMGGGLFLFLLFLLRKRKKIADIQ